VTDSNFVEQLKKYRLLLPPMAGYTDYAYRRILALFDPPFICTEMLSPHAILQENPRTMGMLQKIDGNHLCGAQLVGMEPKAMGDAARSVENLGYDYIDINMGCTVKTVTGTGAGVSLMKDEAKAVKLASTIVEAVNIPVTCKIRLGPSKGNRNAVSLSKGLEDTGITAITVHGRTGERKFGLPVNYEGIREVGNACNIPVIANGGIYTGSDAIDMFQKTGADAVMPGRGLIGNPWLVREILSVSNGVSYTTPKLEERKRICLLHVRYLCEFYGDPKGVIMMKRILPKYFSGCRYLNTMKVEVFSAKEQKELEDLLDNIYENESGMTYSA